jgi:hypothetical protein
MSLQDTVYIHKVLGVANRSHSDYLAYYAVTKKLGIVYMAFYPYGDKYSYSFYYPSRYRKKIYTKKYFYELFDIM